MKQRSRRLLRGHSRTLAHVTIRCSAPLDEPSDRPGLPLAKDPAGAVFHTYSAYRARDRPRSTAYNELDLVPGP